MNVTAPVEVLVDVLLCSLIPGMSEVMAGSARHRQQTDQAPRSPNILLDISAEIQYLALRTSKSLGAQSALDCFKSLSMASLSALPFDYQVVTLQVGGCCATATFLFTLREAFRETCSLWPTAGSQGARHQGGRGGVAGAGEALPGNTQL